MKNKVVVTIADRDYTMVAVEDENYVRKCAQHVDQQLREIANSRISQADAAVLAAMNIADQYFREQDAAENLRRQIKSYLDEISDLKRQLFKAQNQQGHQQNRK